MTNWSSLLLNFNGVLGNDDNTYRLVRGSVKNISVALLNNLYLHKHWLDVSCGIVEHGRYKGPPLHAVLKQTMQKIIIKVQLKCNKCRSKALSIAAMGSGVLSVKLEGDKKDHLEVIGDRMDAVGMTNLIRKKVGHASLEFVDEMKNS